MNAQPSSQSRSTESKKNMTHKKKNAHTAASDKKKSHLTDRQRRILEVIRNSNSLRGYPPSIREIGDAVNLHSTSSVSYQLRELERKGYIRRDSKKPRALDVRLPSEQNTSPAPLSSTHAEEYDTRTVLIPVLGSIAAGLPIVAEQNIEDYLPFPTHWFNDDTVFSLRVSGESMVNAGILDGDWVVIRAQKTAEIGEFVAALIDGEATVKEFHEDSSGTWLLPHNDAFEPIPAGNASIIGKVVSVLRRY